MKGKDVIAGLQNHWLDFGIIASRPNHAGISIRKIFEEKAIAVTRSSNSRSLMTTGDFIAATFVAYRAEDPLLSYAVMPLHSVRGHLAAGSLRMASNHELKSDILLARPEKARDTLVTKMFIDTLHG